MSEPIHTHPASRATVERLIVAAKRVAEHGHTGWCDYTLWDKPCHCGVSELFALISEATGEPRADLVSCTCEGCPSTSLNPAGEGWDDQEAGWYCEACAPVHDVSGYSYCAAAHPKAKEGP